MTPTLSHWLVLGIKVVLFYYIGLPLLVILGVVLVVLSLTIAAAFSRR